MDKLIVNDEIKRTRALIDSYIESKRLAWSPTTIRSERYRLYGVSAILHGNPVTLWGHLESKGMAPYAVSTTWTRVVSFMDWLIAQGEAIGPNKYREWRTLNARQFKNAYERRGPSISYQEALERISKLSSPAARTKARQLLGSGMRFSESLTLKNGAVVGKGNKRRQVFGATELKVEQSYQSFWRQLKEVDLKPHELRKLALSRLVELGATPFDLCEVAGWASVAPALSYVKVADKRIENLVNQLKK